MTTASEPNVIWAGEGEPPASYMDGREAVPLPSAEVAKKGFWTPDPMRLMRLSGGGFKMLVAKGGGAVRSGASRGRINKRGKK